MSKSFVLGFIIGIALLIVAGVGASRLQRKSAEEIRAEEEKGRYETEIVDATPVHLNTLTDKERTHSNIYPYYREQRGERKVSFLLDLVKGKSKIVEIGVSVGNELLPEPESAERFFGRLVTESDVVIRGKVKHKASQITEDDAFIFTDYEIEITEILKNNAVAELDTGSTITVTRPGGKVVVDGIIVKATDESFAYLPTNNREVLLFLHYMPEIGVYKATRNTGSFELSGSSIRPLTGANYPPGVLRGGPSILQILRTSTSK
jgi:hypothetical protein